MQRRNDSQPTLDPPPDEVVFLSPVGDLEAQYDLLESLLTHLCTRLAQEQAPHETSSDLCARQQRNAA